MFLTMLKMHGHKFLFLCPYAVLVARILFNTYSFYEMSTVHVKIQYVFFIFSKASLAFAALNMVEL